MSGVPLAEPAPRSPEPLEKRAAAEKLAAEKRAMEQLELKINDWLRAHLIPRLAEVFRERCSSPEEVECRIARPKGAFFLSDLFFVSFRFPDGGGERSVLIKLPPQSPQMRERQNYQVLFANEILVYEKLLADARPQDYPACYLCGDDPVLEKVIVLENVCPRGFAVCPEKVNLSPEYLVAGVQSIGRFHGHNYALKEREPGKFRRLVGAVANPRYSVANASYAEQVDLRAGRVLRSLRSRPTEAAFADRVAGLFEECYARVLMRCVEPREPLATIVHGDCTVNNLLYRPRPTRTAGEAPSFEAMLVDFALVMYSSPATDVSTFLYLSASRRDIRERFNELFRAYHDSLSEQLKERNAWDPIKYSHAAFLDDYKRHALFGYVLATFFLPMMHEYEKTGDALLQSVFEVFDRFNIIGGGDVLTAELVDMLLDMRELGLLDHWLPADGR